MPLSRMLGLQIGLRDNDNSYDLRFWCTESVTHFWEGDIIIAVLLLNEYIRRFSGRPF